MLFKLLLLFLAVASVMGLDSSIRRRRSPGSSGWQDSNGYGSSSIGLARSGGGWGNGAFGRSSGWGGSPGRSGNTRSYDGYNSNSLKSGCANSNGWDEPSVGFRSNAGSATW